jgi:hypothetical protein
MFEACPLSHLRDGTAPETNGVFAEIAAFYNEHVGK